MNNQFKIDYAYPGLCSLCHAEIANFNGSRNGAPVIVSLKPNYRKMTIQLDDDSRMTVSLCKTCYHDFQPEDMGELMESEINGWQAEMDRINWPKQKKLKHMEKYSKRYAVNRYDLPYGLDELVRVTKPDKRKLKVKTK